MCHVNRHFKKKGAILYLLMFLSLTLAHAKQFLTPLQQHFVFVSSPNNWKCIILSSGSKNYFRASEKYDESYFVDIREFIFFLIKMCTQILYSIWVIF